MQIKAKIHIADIKAIKKVNTDIKNITGGLMNLSDDSNLAQINKELKELLSVIIEKD